jgi:hypothetical protein
MSDPSEYLGKATDIAMKVTAVLLAGIALFEALGALSPKPAAGEQLALDWDPDATGGTG